MLLNVMLLNKVVYFAVGILCVNTMGRCRLAVVTGGGRGCPFTRLRDSMQADGLLPECALIIVVLLSNAYSY